MKTLNLPGGVIIAHESSHTLPEFRRTEHDYYWLIESGIGSTQDDFDRHFDVMIGLIGSPDLEAQFTAINNCRFLFANLLGKQYSAKSLAFCCLVESIDGQKWTDYSPPGVESLSKLLSEKGLTDAFLAEHFAPLKKKSSTN